MEKLPPTDEAIKKLAKWDKQLRFGYRGDCLLKDYAPTVDCTKWGGNHIVGETFLSLIAQESHVLYWDIFSGRMLALQSMIDGKTGRKLPQEISDIRPHCVGIASDPRCQIRGACNIHDTKAFELVETPQLFKAHDHEHQAIIGMSAAFSEAAFLSNAAQWIGNRTRGKTKGRQH